MDVMLFFSKTNNPINRIYPIWESFIMAALPSGCKSRSLSLSFLPCFDQTRQIESYVLGTYNDLILCCVEDGFARDYSICNPYTKQWIALPPTPRVHLESVLTGFTCDHHYYNREEMMDDRTSTSNNKLDYRYRVVRIPAPVVEHNLLEFTVEIFSSETGEWRESVISSSRGFSFTCHSCTPGVAYNGMVCWLVFGGLLIGVDPFNNINNSISTGANITGDIVVNNELCRFVQFHKPEYKIERVECLGVCRGRLRMCHFDLEDPRRSGIVCVWELKEVEEEDDQQADGASRLMKWCLIKKVDLKELVAENPQIGECWATGTIGWCFARVRAFDTNDEDILYLDLGGDIVTFNFGKRTAFVRGRMSPGGGTMSFNALTKAFPLSLPRWPTPLPN
ncbi:PREDICTED: F-box [Prunus dulcis]|uniref:PREDICTED: F-box n=2 Tax=Prunus dulcis TaxID=3755 RepID=A0A5E4FBE3_PRUDU|nr:PREDICTED: F-box [Prunus dulcis]